MDSSLALQISIIIILIIIITVPQDQGANVVDRGEVLAVPEGELDVVDAARVALGMQSGV